MRAATTAAILFSVFLCACGESSDAGVDGLARRLTDAGLTLTCDTTAATLVGRGQGPRLPAKVLRRAGLVVVLAEAASSTKAATAQALNVHTPPPCAQYSGTLAHTSVGSTIVLVSATGSRSPSRGEITAALDCVKRARCRFHVAAARATATASPKPRRRVSRFDQAVADLPVHTPPLRPFQITTFGNDRSRVVASVERRSFCSLGNRDRVAHVAAYARVVDRSFARHGLHGVTLVVSLPMHYAKVRPLAHARSGQVTLTARGLRPSC